MGAGGGDVRLVVVGPVANAGVFGEVTLVPQPAILNPQPSTLNPQPSPLNTQHSTLNTQHSSLTQVEVEEEAVVAVRGDGKIVLVLPPTPLSS